MLKANYLWQNRNCVRELCSSVYNPYGGFRQATLPNFYTTETKLDALDASAFPHGYNTHSAWFLPMKAGALASTLNANGAGGASASILAVKLAEAGLTGSGDLEAVGELIVSLLASLTGSGGITHADIKAFLQLAASLSGSGTVSTGTLTGIGALVAALLGDGTAATSILTGRGAMAADLVVTGTGLTTSNVGQAVWAALAAANNAAGTMGNKLNTAASGGVDYGVLAAEIIAAMNATPPDVNVKKVNDIDVAGTGTELDPWNPV